MSLFSFVHAAFRGQSPALTDTHLDFPSEETNNYHLDSFAFDGPHRMQQAPECNGVVHVIKCMWYCSV